MFSREDRVVTIGAAEVCFSSGQIWRNGRELPIRRNSVQILALLVKHRDRRVSALELSRGIWGSTEVPPERIAERIDALREAIGDNQANPKYIRSYPDHTHQFIGLLAQKRQPLFEGSGLWRKSHTWGIRVPIIVRKRLLWGFIAILLLRFAIDPVQQFLAQLYLTWGSSPVELAVAPLLVSSSEEDRWLSIGLADMTGAGLSRYPNVRVVSTAQSVSWAQQVRPAEPGAGPDETALVRMSQTQFLIVGTASADVGSIRLALRVLRTQDGAEVSTASATLNAADPLAEMDGLTHRLASGLNAASRGETPALAEIRTRSLAAYRSYALGIEDLTAGRFEEAIAHFKDAAKADGQFALAQAWLGAAQIQGLHSRAEAAASLRRATGLVERLPEQDRLFVLGWNGIAREDYPAALAAFRELLDRSPREVDLYAYAGALLSGQGEAQEARTLLANALGRDPQAPLLLNSLAVISLRTGRVDEALSLAERYAGIAPEDWRAHEILGLVYQRMGRMEEAERSFRHALRWHPAAVTPGLHLAAVCYQTGRYRAAVRALEPIAGLAAADARAIALRNTAWILRRKGDRAGAEAALAAVGQTSGTAPDLLLLATHFLERAAKPSPRLRLFAFSETELELGNLEHALVHCREALKHPPALGDLESGGDCVARVHLAENQWPLAVSEYERLLREQPGNALYRFRLAALYFGKTQYSLARVHLDRFLRLWSAADPDIPEVIEARRLGQLGRS
ncbi:MAG: tetratricopeptide repeat protein [Bryobacteraceae bacterium]